jgi:hypothetical protein
VPICASRHFGTACHGFPGEPSPKNASKDAEQFA